jgi:hypothetical protein
MVRAVSHRPFTTEAGFDSRPGHAGFVVVDSGSGSGSSTSTGVSTVTFIPPMLHIHSSRTICKHPTASFTQCRTVYLWNCGNSDPAPASHCTATSSRNAPDIGQLPNRSHAVVQSQPEINLTSVTISVDKSSAINTAINLLPARTIQRRSKGCFQSNTFTIRQNCYQTVKTNSY